MNDKVFIRKTDGTKEEIVLEPGEDILFKSKSGNQITASIVNSLVRISSDVDLYMRPSSNNSVRVSSKKM